jgi:hypothetical protein
MTCQEKNYNFLKIFIVKFHIVIGLMKCKMLIFILFLTKIIGYSFIFLRSQAPGAKKGIIMITYCNSGEKSSKKYLYVS